MFRMLGKIVYMARYSVGALLVFIGGFLISIFGLIGFLKFVIEFLLALVGRFASFGEAFGSLKFSLAAIAIGLVIGGLGIPILPDCWLRKEILESMKEEKAGEKEKATDDAEDQPAEKLEN